MNARIYMLLDILEDRSDYALQILNKITGVFIADRLEGHPNILVVVEAPDRQELVELLMPILGAVERITEDVHLLVSRGDSLASCFHNEKSAAYETQPVC